MYYNIYAILRPWYLSKNCNEPTISAAFKNLKFVELGKWIIMKIFVL